MRLLLDTHALLWWLIDDRSLSRRAHAAIGEPDNHVLVSAISAFEVATKFRLGKLPQGELLASDFDAVVQAQGFAELPVSAAHALRAGSLVGEHRDPFDRMLIAQAIAEGLVLVSNEKLFERYGVQRLW